MTRSVKASGLVVVVTGGREFKDRDFIWGRMQAVHRRRVVSRLVHGGIPGAEEIAAAWATAAGIEVSVCPANWTRYEETAGLRRNAKVLVEHRPDGVIVFPGSVFGDDLARRSAAAQIPVWRPIPRLVVAATSGHNSA